MTKLDRVFNLLERYDDLLVAALSAYHNGTFGWTILASLRQEKESLKQEPIKHGHKGRMQMTRFKPGDLVQIKRTSKSKYKDAIGVVERYCNGHYPNICRVKLWKNHSIQIFDDNIEAFNLKENAK